MSVLCKMFGHDASRSRVVLDAVTFKSTSLCKRCGAQLVLENNRWVAAPESAPA